MVLYWDLLYTLQLWDADTVWRHFFFYYNTVTFLLTSRFKKKKKTPKKRNKNRAAAEHPAMNKAKNCVIPKMNWAKIKKLIRDSLSSLGAVEMPHRCRLWRLSSVQWKCPRDESNNWVPMLVSGQLGDSGGHLGQSASSKPTALIPWCGVQLWQAVWHSLWSRRDRQALSCRGGVELQKSLSSILKEEWWFLSLHTSHSVNLFWLGEEPSSAGLCVEIHAFSSLSLMGVSKPLADLVPYLVWLV